MSHLPAQDWPQWRGVNRDGQVSGFVAPTNWPATLTQKWRVSVGLGDATPALVGGRLYVFTRQGNEEVTRCLSADDGKDIWRHAYVAVPVTGAAESYQGPRSSPAVADGRIITLGVGGVLCCLDAASGQERWRNEEFTKVLPMFFTAMSPLVAEGVCVVHLGGKDAGMLLALDLTTGKAKWNSPGEGPAYSSPVLKTVASQKQLVVQTEKSVSGFAWADGRSLWREATSPKPGYWNSATPLIDGSTVFCTGQGKGTKAVRLEESSAGLAVRELWNNEQLGTVYTSFVLKDGWLYGLSDRGHFFCLDARTGQTAWTATNRVSNFGSIVDAGAVLLALPEKSGVIVLKPGGERYEELARWKVSDTPIYAHPVVAGKRIFIKDRETVTMWAME